MPADSVGFCRLAGIASGLRCLVWLSALAAVSVGIAMSSPGSALAAKLLPLDSPVKIVTPTGGLVTTRHLQVVVQTASTLRSFDARLGRREVRSAFRHVGSGRWVGELTPARGLMAGQRQLTIFTVDSTGRRGTATVVFLVGRMTSTFVRLAPAPFGRFASGTALRLRLRAHPAVFSVRLNGRDATGDFLGLGLVRTGSLGADDGLRYGRNRLVIVVAGANGAYTRITRQLTVPRVGPLAGAGADQRTRSGQFVQLSAASTLRAGRSDRLRFHWVLVSRPHGSKARVRRANSTSPTVRPDLPGGYVLRLEVSEQQPPSAVRGAPRLSMRPAADEVVLSNAPSIRPIGLTVNTMSALPNGQEAIALGDGRSWDIGGADGAVVVALDRATLATEGVQSYNLNDAAYATSYINSLPSTDLVLVAAQNFQVARTGWSKVFGALGATPTSPASAGNFSVIGVPGSTDGGIANSQGEMTGYLREEVGVVYPSFVFVPGKYASYATSSSSSASHNTMTVGEQSFASQTIACPGGGGFQLLALSAQTLQPVVAQTYATNCGNPSNDQQQLASLVNELNSIPSMAGGPHVLLLQSIGTPYASADATQWYAVGLALVQFGGTASVFDGASGAYALAGGDGLSEPGSTSSYGAEASTALTGSGGSLSGELRRDASYHYEVIQGEPGSTGAQALTQLIYPAQPLTPWVSIPASVQQQIIPYITDHFLSPRPDAPNETSCYMPSYDDVRAEYCDLRDVNHEQDWFDELDNQTTPPAGTGFSQANWSAVRKELKDELTATDDVLQYVTFLKSIYYSAPDTSPTVDVNSVYADIEKDLPAPSAPPHGSFSVLAAGVFAFGALDPEIGALFGILGAATTLAGDLTDDSQGNPEINAPILGLTADQLGAALAQRYSDASNELGTLYDIIVSDPGRLHAFEQSPDFNYGFTQLANVGADLKLSTERVAYSTLLSAAYRQDLVHESQTVNPFVANPTNCSKGQTTPCVNDFLCEEETYQWFPFVHAAPDAQYNVEIPQTHTPYGTDSVEEFVIADPTVNGAWYPDAPSSSWLPPTTGSHYTEVATPPETLLKPLFESLSTPFPPNTQQPLQLYKPWFWARTFGQSMVVPGSQASSAAVAQFAQAESRPYYFSCEE
jgi:hypothetical protein